MRFYINEAQITPTGTSEAGRYHFSLPNMPLNIGQNTFNLRIVSQDGSSSQSLQLTHRPEDADAIPAPQIELLSPVDGSLLNTESFLLVARVISQGGPLTITLNGQSVALTPAAGEGSYDFDFASAVPPGNEVSVRLLQNQIAVSTTALNLDRI